MARPTKQGIEYFPIDTEFDDNLQLLIAEVGAEGLGILLTIWQAIYKAEGYYINYDDKFPLKIKQKCFSNVENIVNVVKNAINFAIFSVDMYENYQILTSRGIQKRYLTASRVKKQIEIIPEYMLIDVSNVENIVNVVRNGVSNSRNATYVEVKEKEKVKENTYSRVISYLNKKTGKNYKTNNKNTIRLIKARLNENFTEQDFYNVIDNKCKKWLIDPKMVEFLRPQTLFGTKFESYLQDKTHPLTGTVSKTTMHNIESFKKWRPPK